MRENTLTASFLAGMLLFTSGAARTDAQPPQTLGEATAVVTRLLQSNDVKDVAWGAFTASQYHVVSAVPLLTAALGHQLEANDDARDAVELAILDALAQLDAHVPVETLRPFLDRWPIPTLILLNNAIGERDALLLERLNATSGFEWQAIANLLLKNKPPGFGVRLLEGLRLRLTVYVTDDPNRGFGSALGSAAEHGTNYVLGVAGSALAEYQFVLPPGRHDPFDWATDRALCTSDPKSVRSSPMARSTLAKPRDVDRVQYVNALVEAIRDGTAAPRIVGDRRLTNAQALRRDVSTHRTRVDELYRRVVSLWC